MVWYGCFALRQQKHLQNYAQIVSCAISRLLERPCEATARTAEVRLAEHRNPNRGRRIDRDLPKLSSHASYPLCQQSLLRLLTLTRANAVQIATFPTFWVSSHPTKQLSTRLIKRRNYALRAYTHLVSVTASTGTPIASTSKLPPTPRFFHSTPQACILPFFGFGERDTPQSHASNLLRHLGNDNSEGVIKSYAALRLSILTPERGRRSLEVDKSQLLSGQDLSQALRLLSATAHINTDFRALETIYGDMSSLWELQAPTPEDEISYISALVQSGRLFKAEEWLDRRRRNSAATSDSTLRQSWNILLQGWVDALASLEGSDQADHYARLKTIVNKKMHACGRDLAVYSSLLKILFSCASKQPVGHVEEEVAKVLSRMSEDSLEPDDGIWSTILVGYTSLKEWDLAAGALKQLENSTHGDSARRRAVWDARLYYTSVRYGLEAGLSKLGELQKEGIKPNADTLHALFRSQLAVESKEASARVRFSAKATKDLLARLERAVGILPHHRTYATAMHYATTFHDCIAIHQQAQRDGVPTSSQMLSAALHHMASPTHPEELSSLQAMYSDLLSSTLSDNRDKDGIHNVGLYAQLLQLCARERSPNFSWAIQLLEDMRHNGLALLDSSCIDQSLASCAPKLGASAASIVVNLMQSAATNHSQAFKVYSWTWPLDPDHIFTYRDWYHIIRNFADLDFPPMSDGKRSYVPPTVFFAFFEDMRKSSTAPGSDVFQAVLYYYAREGTRPTARTNQEAVRQIHDVIKMDQFSGTPDIGLMNRLMYAYSKTGNLDGAFNVWRSVLVNKIPYNNVSISIILDAYGYAGRHAYPQLSGLWTRLVERPDFALNKRNLESYIEALGRIGRSRDAVDEVFKHLGEGGATANQPELRPDERTFEVLLKIVRSDGELYRNVLDRVRSQYPDLWRSIKPVATSLPSAERIPGPLLGSSSG